MKTLAPQHLRDQYWEPIESQLKAIFYEIVFAPLMDILQKTTRQSSDLDQLFNAERSLSALKAALRSGRVQYQDGVFSGEFSMAISADLRSFGASLDHRSGVYRADVEKVPGSIKAEAGAYRVRAKDAHEALRRRLDEMEKHLPDTIESKDVNAEETIRLIEKGWQKSARALEVSPKLNREHAAALAADYNKNLKLYIKDFSRGSIKTLRQDVEANAVEGYRFDKLTEQIRHRYGVTANKARFLARQETGLFMAKFRKQRFDQAGVRRYKWSTSHDERVRDSHRHLNGRIFSYDSPPITDRTTGARNNPGEDFNCRCVDIPVLESEAVGA